MESYLTSGKLAALANTSTKALRYYEKIKILMPAYTNPENGYRYYTADQLPHVQLIQACVSMDIPLKELTHFQDVNGQLDFKALLDYGYQIAKAKQAQLEQTLDFIARSRRELD